MDRLVSLSYLWDISYLQNWNGFVGIAAVFMEMWFIQTIVDHLFRKKGHQSNYIKIKWDNTQWNTIKHFRRQI